MSGIRRRVLSMLLAVMMVVTILPVMPVHVHAETNNVLNDQISITNNTGSISSNGSNGTYKITAGGGLMGRQTVTLTIQNISGRIATLNFNYTASNYGSFTIEGASAAASDSYSKLLENNATITLVIAGRSGFMTGDATLTLNNFSLVEAATSSNVTFDYDGALGSVTANGETVASGTSMEVSLNEGVTLAVAANGSTFLGWTDGDGKILSREASYKLTPASDMTVKAAFAKDNGTPWFMVGGTSSHEESIGLLGLGKLYYYTVSSAAYLFNDLNKAANAASNSSSKAIVMMNDVALGAGTYTIPAGVTLLVPFDDANTMYTSSGSVAVEGYTQPTAYRTLTLADGANLIVNGAVSISAKTRYAAGGKSGGSPVGAVGMVKMQGKSNITVNDGGFLYAYGFITGSGSVTVNSGGSVYECFQIMDFRGGSQSTEMQNGVFPMSQYYVQNIEVPMTLHYGAEEYSYTTIYMSSTKFGSSVGFIGPKDSMFNLTSGYVTKWYDGSTDRLMVTSNGDMTISPINLTVGTSSINSKNYELPINSNITVTIEGGTVTIGQDVAMYPGAQIIINEGAICKLGSNVNAYIYDADQWGTFTFGDGKVAGVGKDNTNHKFIPVAYAPGRTYTRTEADLVDASVIVNGTMDASAGAIYTTAGGANISSTGSGVAKIKPGAQTITHQLVQGTGYTEIPITSAKLLNADGTYLDTAVLEGHSAQNYCTYVDGAWIRCEHKNTEPVTGTPATNCTTGGLADGFKCLDCLAVVQETLPPLPHTIDKNADGYIYTAPSCTENGVEEGPCSVCGETAKNTIDSLGGHSIKLVERVEATCFEDGNEEYYACERENCNAMFSDEAGDTVLESKPVILSHKATTSLIQVAAKDATCAEDGVKVEHWLCSCGKRYTEVNDVYTELTNEADWKITSPGHELTFVEEAPASCESEGTMAHYLCSACNKKFADKDAETELTDVTIPATGHSSELIEDDGYPATCIEPGREAGKLCPNCNEIVEGGAEIPVNPDAHIWLEGKKVPATCTNEGTVTYFCEYHNEAQKTETLEKLPHSYTEVDEVPATCTSTGTKAHTKCTVCGGLWVKDENGKLNSVKEADLTIKAQGHAYPAEGTVTKPSTCMENGVMTYVCANGCGIDKTEALPLADHTWDEGTVVKAPTCTVAGETTYKCTVEGCDAAKTENPASLGHIPEIIPATDATCTKNAVSEGKKCTREGCGVTYEMPVEQEGTALGHIFPEEWETVTEATCTTDGEAQHTCTRGCGEDGDVETKTLDKLGHSMTWVEGVDATCTKSGMAGHYSCSRCEKNYSDESGAKELSAEELVIAVNADKHNLGTLTPEKSATCTEDGQLAHYTCADCGKFVAADGKTVIETIVIEAAGHTLGEWQTEIAASCTKEGTMGHYVCSVCEKYLAEDGETVIENIILTKLPHAVGEWQEKSDATCTEDGKLAHYYCSSCEKYFDKDKTTEIADVVIEASGHQMNKEQVAAVPATCMTAGTKAYYTCSNCDAKFVDADGTTSYTDATIVIPVDENAHDWGDFVEVIAATCTVNGLKVRYCNHNKDHNDPEEITALGHNKGEGLTLKEGYAATCTTPGERKHYHCSVCGNNYEDVDGTKILANIVLSVDETNHSYGEWEVKVAAGCESVGTKVKTCAYNSAHVLEEEIPATDHNYGNTPTSTTPATCTAAATKTYTCQNTVNCNKPTYMETVGTSLGHDYDYENGVVTQQETCTVDGIMTYTCTRCAEGTEGHTKTEPIKARHILVQDAIIKEATCMEPGELAGAKCTRCDYKAETEVIPALEPVWDTGVVKTPAICTVDGVKIYTCTLCEGKADGHTNTEVIPAPGTHTYNEGVITTKGTCTVDEIMTFTCTVEGCTEAQTGHSYTKVYTKAPGHNYNEEITTPATCTENGLKTYTCTNDGCTSEHEGHSYTETIPAAHKTVFVAAVEASCTEGNVEHYNCTVCGKNFTDITAAEEIEKISTATGHTEEEYGAQPATCTAAGYEAGIKCSVCTAILVSPKPIPALKHNYQVKETNEPTCEAAGTKLYVCANDESHSYTEIYADVLGHDYQVDAEQSIAATCDKEGLEVSVCTHDSSHKTEKVLNALGHTWDEGKQTIVPTCTTQGEITYTCKNDETHTKTETVKSSGHAWEVKETIVPTCEEAGKIVYTCKNDPAHTKEESNGTALGHDWELTETINPTCTEAGKKLFTCKNDPNHTKEEPGAGMLGHKYTSEVTTAPTCEEPGVRTYTCGNCKDTYTETVDALGHAPVAEQRVEPTCGKDGYVIPEHCSRCEKPEKEILPATGKHNMQVTDSKASTCTEKGWVKKLCQNANCGHTETTELELAPHKEVEFGYVAPTCTSRGSSAGIKCSECTAVIKEPGKEDLDMIPHTGTITIPGKAATCTTTGLTDGKQCSCGYIVEAQQEISVLEHELQMNPATEPTCTEDGYSEWGQCKNCTYKTEKTKTADRLGHLNDVVLEAAVEVTCTTDGKTAKLQCSRCGAVTESTVIRAKGHQYKAVEAKEPDCTESGWEAYEQCSVCEAKKGYKTLPAKGHTPEPIPGKPATCTEDGMADGEKCTVCTVVLVEPAKIKAPGHTIVILNAVKGSCEVDDKTEGQYCSVCDTTLVEQVVTKAPGHDMAPATCIKPATCTRSGCGHTEGEALGHSNRVVEEYPAMCEEPGTTEGIQCSVCGYVSSGMDPIPALGHDLEKYPAKQPTYSSVGWNAYEKCTRCAYTTYEELDQLDPAEITDYSTFLHYLEMLEEVAGEYVLTHPGKDPVDLVIKYIRTGVDRYNSGSWGIMAGSEDKDFAAYVAKYEDEINSTKASVEEMITLTGLKNLVNFDLPNGDLTDIGHMFGTMDITYHNDFGINHADVAGWTGDLVDLLSLTDQFNAGNGSKDIEALVAIIKEDYFLRDQSEFDPAPIEGSFSRTDFYGDLDGLYVMKTLEKTEYTTGTLTEILRDYFTADLTNEDRAAYFIENRMNGVSLRSALREAVYNEYIGNKVIATLEGTREFFTNNLDALRKACCYTFADYICELAGDYVEVTDNNYYTVFNEESSILAPGITYQFKQATTADDEQVSFYLATADLRRDDVNVYANYNENDPSQGWAMQRVLDQANAAQRRYGDPESDEYIENYNVIASINGDGYNMQTGEPGGLLVMLGKEWHPIDGGGFFGILKDGTAMIGSQADYKTYKNQIQEGIGGFGTMLIKDGKIAITATSNYYTNRASRTAVGITATGKVVFLVVDGRQGTWSCGGSMEEIAQMMFEAGCVEAINLDGGGSTTFVGKAEGADELAVLSRPSDGYARSVSTSLMMVSTAPSSTAFDHAVISSDYDYMTVGSVVNITAAGVSATGNSAELPEGTYWTVADDSIAEIDANGVLTARDLGDAEVMLMFGEEVLASETIHVVIPSNLYFTREYINAVYDSPVALPINAVYNNKSVAINEDDVVFTFPDENAGKINGFMFIGNAESKVKTLKITATLADNPGPKASITVNLFEQGDAAFDFDKATGGDRQLAWDRKVSNSTTDDEITYYAINPEEDMVSSYTFAIDMSQIEIPAQLSDLTYMLPGADAADASAWNFLCQLAERISVMTEVRPTIHFDKNLVVDYSDIKLVNERFTLTDTLFDEETNTLTLVLNWIDATDPIDPAATNSICIVSGVKLTPKDDAWKNEQMNLINSGEISYEVCMRASALYSFSQKPENQKVYGLYPFENPNDPSEKGGKFSSVYKEFTDSYKLNKSSKDGWVRESGGYAYYKNGERCTGICEIEGYYYKFNDEGINVGQVKYTGWIEDANGMRYAKVGVLQTGWQLIGDTTYHCHADGYAHTVKDTGTVTCIKGGRLTYVCDNCGESHKDSFYTMPNGHIWDENHKCTVCGTQGIDISDESLVTIGFGTVDKPIDKSKYPLTYVYKSSGVHPAMYGVNNAAPTVALTWSSGASLNSDGTMKDLYVYWMGNKEIGTATIRFTGKGNYYGEKELTFRIVPANVTNLSTSKVTRYTANLTWDASAGADHYSVYECNAIGGKANLIAEKVTGTTFKIEGLTPGATTYYKVRAHAYVKDENAVYDSAKFSNPLAVTTNLYDQAEAIIDDVIIRTDKVSSSMISAAVGNVIILPAGAEAVDFLVDVTDTAADVTILGDKGEVRLTADNDHCQNGVNINDIASLEDGKRELTLRVGDSAEMQITVYQNSGLKELYIVSDNPDEGRSFVEASKSNETTASMKLLSDDGLEIYTGALSQIKTRGNTTFYYDKKAYQIKLDPKGDLLENGEKVKTWVLLANYADATLMHDKLMKDLAAELGADFVASCDWVNLYYDGEYRGVYLLSEKNSVGSTSVDITDLEEFYEKLNDKYGEGMSLSNNYNKYEQEYQFTEGLTDPENITGGYLIERNHDFYDEVNGFKTRQGVAFNVKSPEWSSDRAMAYISEYYQEFEDAVYAVVDGKYTGYNEATGLYYYDYADKESLVRAFILNQFARNPDGFVSSTYFYKDVDGKLVCGPIWDQDITFGTGWSAIIGSHTIQYHYLEEALIQIPDFKEAVIEYYNENVLPLLEELIAKGGVIDEYYDRLAGSAEMNYLLWPYIRVGDPDHDQHLWEGVDYEYVVEDLKTWIAERIDVLSEQWEIPEDVEEIEYILGDIDDDGEITTSDASGILRYIVGYEDVGICIVYGDVDEDGEITTSDASNILRWLVGYEDNLAIGETRRMPVAP